MKTCQIDDCSKAVKYKGLCSTHYNRVRVYGDPHKFKRIRHSGTDADRFWAKVDRTGTCWIWIASRSSTGYGHFMSSDRRNHLAHRFAYQLTKGAIPKGSQLDHTCFNRLCVNPGHLRPVNNKQNNENMAGPRKDNLHGHRGVGFNKRTKKFRARVYHHGRDYYAGEHTTPQEAAEAARQLRLSLFTHNDLDRMKESAQ